jgi:hypothetical protein
MSRRQSEGLICAFYVAHPVGKPDTAVQTYPKSANEVRARPLGIGAPERALNQLFGQSSVFVGGVRSFNARYWPEKFPTHLGVTWRNPKRWIVSGVLRDRGNRLQLLIGAFSVWPANF